MQPLLSSLQMREADRESVEEFSIPEIVLMEHAGIALVHRLELRYGKQLAETRGVVVAGPGNNGGDVLCAARLLHEKGCTHLFVVLFDNSSAPSESTARQLKILGRLGVAWGRELGDELLSACDWVLDGLLGTGLSREVSGEFHATIEQVNRVAEKKWIVSADIPSGLCSDTGLPRPISVRASETVALGFYKKGLVTGAAADYVGQLTLAPIQIPRTVSSAGWDCFLYTREDAKRLPSRRATSNKGDFGHVAVVAGKAQTLGACALTALGALRTGAGLTTVLGDRRALEEIRSRLAVEIMTESFDAFLKKSRANTLVVGPGLGTDEEAMGLLEESLGWDGTVVCDADALNLMAGDVARWLPKVQARKKLTTVFTPHPKEAARLLSSADREISAKEIQQDRYRALNGLVDRWGCSIVLKGAGTLVGSPVMPVVAVTAGDPGLAKGGTGDLLAGVIASLLAQGIKSAQALPLAVYLHGKASQLLSERLGTNRSSTATEIASVIPEVFRELECHS